MSIESQILNLLETRLKTILTANGYNTSAGTHVYRNLQYATSGLERPGLVLFTGENNATYEGKTPPSLGEQNHFLHLKIEGFVDDNERGEQAALLRADLTKILFSDQYYNGLADGYEGAVQITSEPQNSGDDGFIGYTAAEFILFYVTATGEI